MVRSIVLAAAILAIAGPSYGQSRCNKPYAPVIAANAKATKQDMANIRSDVTAFIEASDVYQSCITRRGDPAGELLIGASQREKERVARQLNTALQAFRASNPS